MNWHLRFLNLCFYTKKQKAIVGYKVGFWLDEFSMSLRDKTRERERERERERGFIVGYGNMSVIVNNLCNYFILIKNVVV